MQVARGVPTIGRRPHRNRQARFTEMTISRRGLVGGGVPMFLLGAAAADAQDPASRLATLATGKGEVRRLEDFGAKGDFDPQSGRGTDDTLAIQTAIDWAYDGGRHSPGRALLVESRNYLCGPITTNPYTTIIGTGRQTSGFWCRKGTRGAWWSDRGRGAQKLMLSGLAWYAQNETGVDAIARFGRDGMVFGTEGILQGLWLRGAPSGIGLDLVGNVGILRDITVQDCETGIVADGNGNQLENIFSMQTRFGARFNGCFVRGLHLEAIESGGLPLAIGGDCRISDAMVSLASDTVFDNLVAIDTSRYDEWSLTGIQIFPRNARLRRGVLKVAGQDRGGTRMEFPHGLDIRQGLDLASGRLSLKRHRWRCFMVEIAKRQGRLLARAVTPGATEPDRELTAFLTRGAELAASTATSIAIERGRVVLDTAAIEADGFALTAAVQFNSTGVACTAEAGIARDRAGRLQIALHDALTGEPWDPVRMREASMLRINITGFGG